jgi:hypothetical protein
MSETGRHYRILSMGCGFATLLVAAGILTVIAGCGGGGGSSTNSVSPTITSVTANCSLSAINTAQTSTCTATVSGTGSYSSAVTWSVSPTSMGTVSSGGVFTPAGAGTATITATSTQDSTKSGSATVTVTLPAPSNSGLSADDDLGQRRAGHHAGYAYRYWDGHFLQHQPCASCEPEPEHLHRRNLGYAHRRCRHRLPIR